MKGTLVIFAIVFVSITLVESLPARKCSKEARRKAQEEFLLCQARAQTKFKEKKLDVCQLFKENIEHCVELLASCSSEEKVRQMKERSVRLTLKVLSLEEEDDLNYENCEILKDFDLSDHGEKSPIDGKCSSDQFQTLYKRFVDCRVKSEAKLREKITKAGKDQSTIDDHVCDHFEHTLDTCFEAIHECAENEKQWIHSRQAFITSATKTNQANKDKNLNLHKCDLRAVKKS